MKVKEQNSTEFFRTAALFLTLTLLFTGLLSGCGKKTIQCPFTDLGWDATTEELFEKEGPCEEPYNSTYGGLVYTYPSSYMGYDGTIKYMFDENNILMNVAFAYSSEEPGNIKEFYDRLSSGIEEEYGKSSYDTDTPTNYGKVWELNEGHIILSVLLTDSNKALQIAYVNPLDQEKE